LGLAEPSLVKCPERL